MTDTTEKTDEIFYLEYEDGKPIPAKDIKSNHGLKRGIVELVNKMPKPDRECELIDFLNALQYLIDRYDEQQKTTVGEKIAEGRDVIESEIESLPSSPFFQQDLSQLIIKQVENRAFIDGNYSVRHSTDYQQLENAIIQLLKQHML